MQILHENTQFFFCGLTGVAKKCPSRLERSVFASSFSMTFFHAACLFDVSEQCREGSIDGSGYRAVSN